MVEFDRVIPPGGEGKIRIEIKERTRPGPFIKTITVKSDAPDQQNEKLVIKTFIYKLLEISPQDSLYVTGFRGESWEQTLTVTNRHDEPIRILGLNVDNPDIQATLMEGDTAVQEVKLEPEESVNLHLKTLETIPIGRIKGVVSILTDNAKVKDAVVNIRGVVRHHIMVSPSHVRFMFFGTDNVVREREVRVMEKGEGTFKITSVSTTDPNVEVETLTEKEGKQYKLNLTYTKVPETEGTRRGIIVIKTDDAEMPELNLPFSVTLRPVSNNKPAWEQEGLRGSADRDEDASHSQE